MTAVTADQLINSLKDPISAADLAHLLYVLNKDLQDAKAAISAATNVIVMNPPMPVPGSSPVTQIPISKTNQGKIYFDPILRELMVSQNGSPYIPLVGANPHCILASTTAQSVANNPAPNAILTWAAADIQSDIYSLVDITNNRIRFNFPGAWLIGAEVYWAGPGADNIPFYADIESTSTIDAGNGGVVAVSAFTVGNNVLAPAHSLSALVLAAKGDSIKVTVSQTSGGAMFVIYKRLWACLIGPPPPQSVVIV